jgi:hypothetical protein
MGLTLKAITKAEPKFRMIFNTIYICDKEKDEAELHSSLGESYFAKNPNELEAFRACITYIMRKPLSNKYLQLPFAKTTQAQRTRQQFQNILRGGRTKSYWDIFSQNFANRYHKQEKSRSGAIFFSLYVLGRFAHFAIFRFDFEANVLQILRKGALSAISDAIVSENIKKCFVYPVVEGKTGRLDYGQAWIYQSNYSGYFPEYCSVASAPTKKEIAKEIRTTSVGPQIQIQSLVSDLSERIASIKTPYVELQQMTINIDDVEIRFRVDQYDKKVYICEFGDRKVALVVGTSITPTYGESLVSPGIEVKAKRVDNLNALVS